MFFTPTAQFVGTASFTYVVEDADGNNDEGAVTLTVGGVEDIPVAEDDDFTIVEDTAIELDVLDNDSDGDGDDLSIVSITSVVGGTATVTSDETVLFTPTAQFVGTGSFTYTIEDVNSNDATASVTVTVGGVEDIPVAEDDVLSIVEDTATELDVLDNDSDGDGDDLSIVSITSVVGGTATVTSDETVLFTPTAQFTGAASFSYVIEDVNGNQDGADVSVTVGAVEDIPIAEDDAFTIVEDTATEFDVLANDTDNDGDALSIFAISDVVGGTAEVTSDDNILFTPTLNLAGTASFTYTIADVNGNQDEADVTITITGVVEGPLADDDAFEILEDTPTSLPVLDNDIHPDGIGFEVVDVINLVGGTAQIDNATGEVVFSPDNQFVGSASFTYVVLDVKGVTDEAVVTVLVTFVNDAPVLGEDAVTLGQGESIVIDVLANDSDAEGGTLSVVGVGSPGNGSTSIVGGSIQYTPNPAFSGEDSFDYTADDGTGGQATGTVNVVVIRANTPPVAVDDVIVLEPEVNTATIDLKGNDTDDDGDPLAVVEITQPQNGSAATNSDGTIFYRRNGGFNGIDTFSYTIEDGHGGSDTGTVTVEVKAPPGAPLAVSDEAGTGEEEPVTIAVLSNDNDGGEPSLSVSGAGGASNGAVVANDDGTVTYTPNPNFGGSDKFTYTITNGAGLSASATVTVTVTGTNDPPSIQSFDDFQAVENNPFGIDLLQFAFDPDNSPVQLHWEVMGVSGPVEFANLNGHSLTVVPRLEESGTGSVSLVLIDLDGARDEGEVFIFFKDVDDPPVFDPNGFSPADGTVGVPRSVALSWSVNDPDSPNLLHSVRLGRVSNILNTAARDQTSSSFTFQAEFNEEWFYQIVVTDGTTEVESPVIGFVIEGDTRKPVVSQLDVVGVTENSARVVWVTDKFGSSQVTFSQNADLSSSTDASSTDGTDHAVALIGLDPDAIYYFQVSTTDAVGNVGESGVETFATLRARDILPPGFFAGPFVEGIDDQSASVRFETDEVTIGQVILTAPDGTQRVNDLPDPGLDHLTTFDGLLPATDYTVDVEIADVAGNVSNSGSIAFTTTLAPDIVAPTFERRPDVNATHIAATIDFDVNEPATAIVNYGLAGGTVVGLTDASGNRLSKQATFTDQASADGVGGSFSVSLTGLDPNTEYGYEVVVTDLADNPLSASGSFKTLRAPDLLPPIIVEGPDAQGIGQDQATVVWLTDEPAFSRVVFDTLDISVRSFRTPLTSAVSSGHSHLLGGLTAGVTYNFEVFSVDAAGNETVSGGHTFGTLLAPDITLPILVSQPVTSGLGFDRLTVEWGTNEASSSEIVATPTSQPALTKQAPAPVAVTVRRVEPSPVTDHSLSLTGLVGDVEYSISIKSVDAASNELNIEGALSVRTLKVPDVLPPKIVKLPEVVKVTESQARIFWGSDEPADGFVEVDTLADFSTSFTFGSTTPNLERTVTATNLKGSKTYFYRVSSTDVLGNGPTQFPVDAPLTFRTLKTPDILPPLILEGPVAVSPGISGVTIKWKTNEPSNARVRFGFSADALSDAGSVFDPSLSKDHVIPLSGLEPDTLYFYDVVSIDTEGNGPTISDAKTFTTLAAPDIFPPQVLSGPSVVDKTTTSALFEWTTDEPATSEVDVNNVLTSRSEGAQTHRVQVTGLSPETSYSFTVISTDAAGNTTQKPGNPFTTPALPDIIPPEVLEGPGITYKSDNQVTVSWKTDEPATSKLTLWPSDNPDDALPPVSDGGFKRDHSVTGTGLIKGTNYDYRIESSDATGNTVVAGTLTGFVAKPGVVTKLVQPVGGGSSFFTNLQPDTQFPVILKGPHVVASTSTTLTVEWSTDESSDSGVGFGTDGLALRVENGADVLGHRVVLTNLDPNTSYQYQVESTDPAGNGATKSRVFLAKTAAAIDATPPRITAAPKVIYKTERQATITWETDEGAQTFLEFGTEALTGQQSLPDFVTKHQVTLTNLASETTYKYRVRATDAAGNGPAQSQELTFITEGVPDRILPQITVAPTAEAITDVSAVLKWQTDELSDSAVNFAAGDNLTIDALGLLAGSATDVETHEVVLTNLLPNTTYSFVVQSTDRSGNGPVSSAVVTFTTAAGKDEIPPAIPTRVSARGANGQLVVSWTAPPDPDVAGYDVLRAVGEGDFSPVATLVPNPLYRDDGLSETTVYRYQIRALDATGNQSALSVVASASPDGTGLPGVPTVVGVEGDLTQPLLVVQNALSSADLVYNFEVASDEAFGQVVAQASGIAQGSGTDQQGATAWQVDIVLEQGATYYWRASAFDGVFDGPFMVTATFVVASTTQPVVNPGDFDGDLQVGFGDFIQFVSGFGSREGQPAYQKVLDLDGSGDIGFPDFITFAGLFGKRY